MDADVLAQAPKNPVNVLEKQILDMNAKLESCCAAFNRAASPSRGNSQTRGEPAPRGDRRTRLPRPDPSFKGCWHCGGDHAGGRRQCPKFKEYLKQHGGKIPPDYEGAYEKHLREKGIKRMNRCFAYQDAEAVASEHAPQAPAQQADGPPVE